MNVKKFAWILVVLALLQPAISRRKYKGKCVGQYTCQRTTVGSRKSICINQYQFCNGKPDCPNAEDEHNCERTWAGWMDWNDCSRSCGGGHRVRYRTCSNPVPSGKGPYCAGQAAEVSDCATQSCAVNGGWTGWQGWGDCNKTCGGGMRTRVRTCTCPPPSGGGFVCKGDDEEQTNCAMNGCPVDGEWTEWSDCACTGDQCPDLRRRKRAAGDNDTEEAEGRKTRYRSCTMPRPSLGGEYCSGDPVEEDVPCVTDFVDCSNDDDK